MEASPADPARDMDLLFVSMPSRANSPVLPLAYVILSGYLDKYTEFRTAIFDPKIPLYRELTPRREREMREALFERIEEEGPRWLGFSLFPGERRDFLSLAAGIKSRFSDVRIVVGGVLPSVDADSLVFEGSPVDVAVRGDGELPCRSLLEDVPAGEIPGLVWWEEGLRHENGVARYDQTIDYIPSYEKVDMRYYTQPWVSTIRPYYTRGIGVMTSRGCPFSCHFCFNAKRNLKFKKPSVLVEELRLLKERYGVNSFFVMDECFLVRKQHALEFCTLYGESGLGMPFAIQTRANMLTEELVETLAGAGCVHISFGVESGSNEVLARINKGLTVEENLEAFRLCRRHGIKTFANMMFNIPGETEADIALSQKFLKEARPTHVGMSLTVPLLGTQIYQDYMDPPLSPDEYDIYANNNAYTRIVEPRFRLAAHDVDLDRFMIRASIRYYLRTSFGLLSLDSWYLRGVLFRTNPLALLKAILMKAFIQFRSYGRGSFAVIGKRVRG